MRTLQFCKCVHHFKLAFHFWRLTMEEASLRFPHLTDQIFEKLDNVSLTKCRKISNWWQYMIDNRKEVWIRKIKIHINCSQAYVKSILRKKNTETLAVLANEIQQLWLNHKYVVSKDYQAYITSCFVLALPIICKRCKEQIVIQFGKCLKLRLCKFTTWRFGKPRMKCVWFKRTKS